MKLLSRLEIARVTNPSATTAQCVVAVAEQVLDELELREPPVDVEMLASLLGIHAVVADWDLDAAGCLICRHGDIHIRVRGSDNDERQRFTICHECAHTFFPGFAQTTRYRCSPRLALADRKEQSVEHLCDLAASELLLPRRLLRRDLERGPLGLDLIEDLAPEYGASIEATAHRILNLATQPLAFLVLEVRQAPRQEGTKAEPRLRLRTAHTANARHWPYFLQHKSVADKSPFGRALAGEDVDELSTIDAICRQPLSARVIARSYPYWAGAEYRQRVMAILLPTEQGRVRLRD